MKRDYFSNGFSLIEIMVVIVIISILTSLAAVSYRSYIVKARRTAVQEELLKYQQSMEEYFSLNHSYGSSANGTATCANIFPSDKKSSEGFYTLSCTLDGGYKLEVTATGSQAKDDADCAYMYLFRNGSRGGGKASGNVSSNACW